MDARKKRKFNQVIIGIIACLFTFASPIAFAGEEEEANLNRYYAFVHQCLDNDYHERWNALRQLEENRFSKKETDLIVKLIIQEIQNLDMNFNPSDYLMRRRAIRNASVEMSIAAALSAIDNEDARYYALSRVSLTIGVFSVGMATRYIGGLPVSAFMVARSIVVNQAITFEHVVEFLLNKSMIIGFNDQDPAVYTYIMLEKLKKDHAIPWTEGKSRILERLETYDKNGASSIDPTRDTLIVYIRKFCEDPNLSEANANDPNLSKIVKP